MSADLGSTLSTIIIGVIIALIVGEAQSYKRHGKEALRRLYHFMVEKQVGSRFYASVKSAFSWLMDKVHG